MPRLCTCLTKALEYIFYIFRIVNLRILLIYYILNIIAEEGRLSLCVEIGPGLGTLTSSLLKRFDKVIAVEFDAELAKKLPGSFRGRIWKW